MGSISDKINFTRIAVDNIEKALARKGYNMSLYNLGQYAELINQLINGDGVGGSSGSNGGSTISTVKFKKRTILIPKKQYQLTWINMNASALKNILNIPSQKVATSRIFPVLTKIKANKPKRTHARTISLDIKPSYRLISSLPKQNIALTKLLRIYNNYPTLSLLKRGAILMEICNELSLTTSMNINVSEVDAECTITNIIGIYLDTYNTSSGNVIVTNPPIEIIQEQEESGF